MASFAHKRENTSKAAIHSVKQQNQPPCSLLAPYGTIPKYNKDKKRKKTFSSQKQNHNQKPPILAPYPYFQLALSSRPSFLTSLAHKWFTNPTSIKQYNKPTPSLIDEKSSALSPVGFMPRTLPPTADMAYLSSVKVTAPMTIHNHRHDHQQETSSSFSSYSTTSSSSSSLEDNSSFSSIDSWNNRDSDTLAKETHYSTSSHYYKTASTLSGLLCENYVQSQLMIMAMMDDDATEDEDVENDTDGCPMTCPSLTPTSTSSTSTSSTSSSTSTTDPFLLDTLIYPSSSSPCTFDNKIFDTTTTDPSTAVSISSSSSASNNKDSSSETLPIDVPLATFRMFRARDDENDNNKENNIWNGNMPHCNENDDTMTKNDASFGSYDDDHHSQQCDEKKTRTNGTLSTTITTTSSNFDEMQHHHHNEVVYSGKEALLENSWANWKKAWQGKQWVLSMSEQDEKKDDCLPRTSSSGTNKEDQQNTPNPTTTTTISSSSSSCVPPSHSPPPPPIALIRSREPRVNSAHLRMLVAEVNMMRADKIVGPLRPRNYLLKRNDPLPYPHHPHTPSPLSLHCVSVT